MLFNIIIKCIIVYIIILLSLKFMGKREIAQVSIFDFAIILIISDILVIGIDEENKWFWYYFIGVIVLTIIQRVIAFLILKNRKVRTLFEGNESIIIYNGKLNIKEMKKQRYNMDDLITQLRINNIASIKEVKYLILESNGNISVFKEKDNPINPFPLIISGKVIYKNLKLLNLSLNWLEKELKLKNDVIENIYYASLDENDKLYIVPLYDVNNHKTINN